MADDRPFDAFVRITAEGEYVVITVRGQQYEATPSAAREIARNLLRKAEQVDEKRQTVVIRRGHLRRVK